MRRPLQAHPPAIISPAETETIPVHGFFDGRLCRERRQSGRFDRTGAPFLFASGALIRPIEIAHRHHIFRKRLARWSFRLLPRGQNVALAAGLTLMPLMMLAGTLADWLH